MTSTAAPPIDFKLTDHFFLSELTASQAAERRGIRNVPSEAQQLNLYRLAMMLEQVRSSLGDRALLVSSGYRNASLNVLVGGAINSDHLDGRAADFTVPGFGDARLVAQAISESGIEFDQLIYEGTWVHISVAKQGVKPRKQILTARFTRGAPTRYLQGIV
jgi:zinc D-Ala-D-Ala carboxypeptidase